VQVKRKINGGDIDWALGAATWSLKWVGLGKHLQEQWIFRDSILGWAWHHDRFESNGGNLATAKAAKACASWASTS